MITTKYIDSFDKNNPLSEYPRPQLVRNSYLSLNGSWNFKVSKQKDIYVSFDERIVVPYCMESLLSGLNRKHDESEYLFYQKTFTLDKDFLKDRVILHFDAIDQICKIYLNKKEICFNEFGYLPIILDITDYLNEDENEIIVRVKDEINLDYPYGKQSNKPNGIWYTNVSGIWQSVWLEAVSNDYIKNIKITPDIDNNKVNLQIDSLSDRFEIVIYDDGKEIYHETKNEKNIDIYLENPKYWSPEDPHLYYFDIKTKNDFVKSYFAMRKFSTNDKYFLLNNKPYFLNGLLDQGFFPDGIYTPASYEAYENDILTMKSLGFNCLRKHIKIEPLRFYYFCDLYGMLVLQDIVNNGNYNFVLDTVLPNIGVTKKILKFKNITDKQKEMFERAERKTIDYLYNVVSLCYYTIFNEAWGQHNADYYYQIAKEMDPTRVIDPTSGWIKENDSDVESLHIYFKKIKIKKANRPIIISEFGGYSYACLDHLYTDKNWGYRAYKTLKRFQNGVNDLYLKQIIPAIKNNNLAGCIYTQVSDVETEINGLFSYDRKVLKVDDSFKEVLKQLKEAFNND